MKLPRLFLRVGLSLLGVLSVGQVVAESAIELLSVSTGGQSGFDDSREPAISADGRYVAFVSADNSIGPAPALNSSGGRSIYVRDRVTGQTTRITDQKPATSAFASIGADNECFSPSISADGRLVVFTSFASNLAPQGNGTSQIMLCDRVAHRFMLISARPDGKASNGVNSHASLSGDGRFVAFLSTAADLVADDTNGQQDVFVRELATGRTQRVSVATSGAESHAASPTESAPRLSFDGRYVAFASSAADLVSNDANGALHDIFVHDRTARTTTLASIITNSAGSNVRALQPDLSADGQFVAYTTFSSALSEANPNALEGAGSSYLVDRAGGFAIFARSSTSSPRVSADAHFIAFVANSGNGNSEVKVEDLYTPRTIFAVPRVGASNNTQTAPAISADASTVAFETAQAITPNDFNGARDVFATPLTDSVALVSSVYYISETGGSVALQIRRVGVSLEAISVKYSISATGDTAVSATDYIQPRGGLSGTLTWAAGDGATKTLTIPIINRSATTNGYRAFTFALSSPSSRVRLGAATASVVIGDSTGHPVEDQSGHALRITRLTAVGTSWDERLFRGQFTVHNGSALGSFAGQIDYIYQRLNSATRQPDGDPEVLDTVPVEPVLGRGDLTFFSKVSLDSQFNGTQLDGILYAKLYELTPSGGRVLQDTALAATYNTTEGVLPPAGGSTQPSAGTDAPGFRPVQIQSVTINAPAQVNENGTNTLTATVKLNNGTTLNNASPQWRTSAFAISPSGTLTTGEVTRDGSVTVTASVFYNGATTSGARSVVIKNVPATPVITSAGSAFVSLNKPATYRIIAVHEPDTFAATNLPAGLSLNTATGVISGTPSAEGNFNVSLSATNEIGTVTKMLTLTVSSPKPLTVTRNGTGAGEVKGIGKAGDAFPRTENRDVGRTYTLTAQPASGSLFAGWAGGLTSSSPALTFVMIPNLSLEARFVVNPYLTRAGTYVGRLVSSPVSHEGAGALRITVATTGGFTGAMNYGGRTYPLRGLLSPSGAFTKPLVRAGLAPLTITLQLDLAQGSQAITGTVTDGVISSMLSGQRVLTNAGALAGRYTVLLPAIGDSTDQPQGAGYGTLTVSAAGSVKLAGMLNDGTPLSIGGNLLNGGTWPIYTALYGGGGSLSGSGVFVGNPQGEVTSALSWFKPVRLANAYYPNGWPAGLTLNLRGGLYAEITPGNRRLIAHGGGLLGDQAQDYSVDADGKVTSSAPVLPRFALRFTAATGLFSGSFLDPFTNLSRTFNGAVLQSTGEAIGIFKGGDKRTGLVDANVP